LSRRAARQLAGRRFPVRDPRVLRRRTTGPKAFRAGAVIRTRTSMLVASRTTCAIPADWPDLGWRSSPLRPSRPVDRGGRPAGQPGTHRASAYSRL